MPVEVKHRPIDTLGCRTLINYVLNLRGWLWFSLQHDTCKYSLIQLRIVCGNDIKCATLFCFPNDCAPIVTQANKCFFKCHNMQNLL